jgi:Na+/H+ antiporter NhaD/arsenite permease-like protein
LNPDLYVFSFQQALNFIEFEVIFLLLGMMIIIGVIEETGIFQWLAYRAYRLSRQKVWLLTIILMLITLVTAALLDNAVTMLLITPIMLEIALALGLNPLSLLLPAVLSANVGGMATLVGTPVNIIIGSYAGLGFNAFLAHLSPATLLVEAGLIAYVLFVYRREHRTARRKPSARLLLQLEQDSRIKDPVKLRKAGAIFAALILLFIFGEALHLSPSVAALASAVVMLIWVNPDIEQMMGAVDWTTLVFFMGLYMMIGAVQEVGLLAYAADGISALVGNSLTGALLATVWISTILSGLVDNVPFTAAMLPVVGFLSRSVPAAGASPILFYALAVGANLGGNATLIGSSANLVVKGIAERAGFSISFMDFLKIGLPATLITTMIGCIWLFVHFR